MRQPRPTTAAELGMWVFLGSELLFFSGVFLALSVYRYLHPASFLEGTRHMNLGLGSLNTLVLLTSSWSMVSAIERAGANENKQAHFRLLLTAGLGLIFLLVKSLEYLQHYHEGLFPWLNWRGEASGPLLLFFLLYFFATLLHSLHVSIGIGCVAWSARALRLRGEKSHPLLENIGLYWHFVDIVWVFLFPLLYLMGRAG